MRLAPVLRLSMALPILLLSTLGSACHACESPDKRAARERREDSERDLARLLETRACVDCYVADAELAGRDLRGIKLRGTFLHGNLREANLRGAELTDVGLGGDLRGIDLRGARVSSISFTPRAGLLAGARLDGLDLRTVRFPDYTDWSYAHLRGANLEGVRFAGLSGPHGRMDPQHPLDAPSGGSAMRGVDLREANLRSARLWLADLRSADLRGANLAGALLPRGDGIAGARLEGATAPDGSICMKGSVGHCLTAKGKQPPWRQAPR